jgi:hypothetical protein
LFPTLVVLATLAACEGKKKKKDEGVKEAD